VVGVGGNVINGEDANTVIKAGAGPVIPAILVSWGWCRDDGWGGAGIYPSLYV